MTWTNEKPKAPGWYWYRERKPFSGIVWVDNREGFGFGYFDESGDFRLVDQCSGQFAGPIPEPEEFAGGGPIDPSKPYIPFA